jgi:hypothetical protein
MSQQNAGSSQPLQSNSQASEHPSIHLSICFQLTSVSSADATQMHTTISSKKSPKASCIVALRSLPNPSNAQPTIKHDEHNL